MPNAGQDDRPGAGLHLRANKIGLSNAELARATGLYQKTVAHVWTGNALQRHAALVERTIAEAERDVLRHLAGVHPDLIVELSTVALCGERNAA